MRTSKRSSRRVLSADRRRVGGTAAVALVLLCVTTVAAVILALVYHLGVAATLVTILVGLPALYMAWEAYWDAHRGAGADAGMSLAEIADGLAGSVGSSWEGEAADGG